MQKLGVLAAMLSIFLSASAYDFEVGGIYYNITDAVAKKVEVTSGSFGGYSGDIVVPSSVTYESEDYSVTAIGKMAFQNCTGLTSISIPNTVTTIGSWAFSFCNSLTKITIPGSVTAIKILAFSNCSSLTNIEVDADNQVYSSKDGILYNKSQTTLKCCPGGKTGNVIVPNTVTTIGDYAFDWCDDLTSIVIPNSVTTIGEESFSYCSSLTSITIPNSVTTIGSRAFQKCSSLTSITIPNSVTTIGIGAFQNCDSLTTITLPNTLTTIGEETFSWCSNLTTIVIPNTVTTIGDRAFYWCSSLTSIALPNSVTTIGKETFCNCDGLTTITLPNTLTTIGKGAFAYCSSLTSIALPNTLKTIGEETFYNCSGLTTITLPNTVTAIGDRTFSYCDGLTNIEVAEDNQVYSSKDGVLYDKSQTTLICCPCGKAGVFIVPNTVTTVGGWTFLGCSGLTSIEVEADNQAYSSIGGILYDKSQTTLICCPCGKAGDIIIPNTVTTIGDGAFADCSDLTSIALPNTVTTIGSGAFQNCSSLTTMVIPNTVTTIREETFYWCSGLTSIVIPGSVTAIGPETFGGCFGLRSITSLAVTPPGCGRNVFDAIDKQKCTLYVPAGSVDAYMQAPEWKDFNLVEEAETGIDSIEAVSAVGTTEVFNLAGLKVADTIENLPAGIYIVREGLTARKIVVR